MLVIADLLRTCAICGSSKADNGFAFALTALALASVPLLLISIGVFFLVRAHRGDSNQSTRD